MKLKLALIFALVTSVCLAGGGKYGNVITLWYGDVLPKPLAMPDGLAGEPTLRQYQQMGFRYVTVTNIPAQTNLIATSYTPTDINGTNCFLAVSNTYDWVAANAQAASNAAAQKQFAISNYVFTTPEMAEFVWRMCNTNKLSTNQMTVAQGLAIANFIINKRP
jgi:hypothetical protein